MTHHIVGATRLAPRQINKPSVSNFAKSGDRVLVAELDDGSIKDAPSERRISRRMMMSYVASTAAIAAAVNTFQNLDYPAGGDPIFDAIAEHEAASKASRRATDEFEEPYFAARARLGAPADNDDREWYRRARLIKLKADLDQASLRYRRAWHALPLIQPTTTEGAAALIRFVLRDVEEGAFDDSADSPHWVMLANAASTLATGSNFG